MRTLIGIVVSLCLAGSVALAGVTQADAKKIALAKVPGTVVHESSKKKDGHTFFHFKIKPKGAKGDAVKKVEVDEAGKIVKVKDAKAKDKD